MANIEKYYTDFHLKRMGMHCYPNEFLVRTMLGKYPNLKLEHNYEGKNVLDLGCGDGRNMILLNNLGLNIHGVEITQEICTSVTDRMAKFGINADIRVGRNSTIPFENNYFDYVVASASLYYVDNNDTFDNTMAELTRVTKQGGYIIATLACSGSILNGAKELNDNHYEITNDPFELRNGNIFKVHKSKEQIIKEFSPYYDNISIGAISDDYYGLEINMWLLVARKR